MDPDEFNASRDRLREISDRLQKVEQGVGEVKNGVSKLHRFIVLLVIAYIIGDIIYKHWPK